MTCLVTECCVDKRIQLSSITLLGGFQLSFEVAGKKAKSRMRKFNCPLSSFNHWTPSSKDVIHTKTEISLQSHFYYGSSKSLNTPHPNKRYFLQKDMDLQACQVQDVKIHGMTVLKIERWILDPPKQQQSSGTTATEKEEQPGCCAKIREESLCIKMYHQSNYWLHDRLSL